MPLDWTKIEALKVLLSHPVGPGVSVQITAQSEDDRAAVAGIINAAREHLGPLIEECERLAKELQTARDCEDIAKDAETKAYQLMVEAQKRESLVRAGCERLRAMLREVGYESALVEGHSVRRCRVCRAFVEEAEVRATALPPDTIGHTDACRLAALLRSAT